MIVTITPNPALDLSGSVTRILPNEKNYLSKTTRYPGGNGVNAARVIAEMGIPVRTTGFLGGPTGNEVSALLAHPKITQNFVPIEGDTRVNFTVSTESEACQYRFSFPGPAIGEKARRTLSRYLNTLDAPALFILGGSFPPGLTARHAKALIRHHQRRGVPVIVDVPSVLLKQVVGAHPFLVKPNLSEFQAMADTRADSIPSLIHIVRQQYAHIPLVVISSVKGGALLIAKDAVWFGRGPRVHVSSAVGAGDSMVGAMSAKLWEHGILKSDRISKRKGELADALRWGIAAAVATLKTPGTALASGPQIRATYRHIAVKKIM